MALKQKSTKYSKKGYSSGVNPPSGGWGVPGKKDGISSKKINAGGVTVHNPMGMIKDVGAAAPLPIHYGADIAAPLATVQDSESERALAAELVDELDQSSTDVKALSKEYGLTREELGRLTGFSVRALAEWAADKIPSLPAQRRLHEVRRLLDALSEVVDKQSIPKWLHKRNPAFDSITPLQVIELGEIDRIWGMIYEMAASHSE